jgi:hypothetical protein
VLRDCHWTVGKEHATEEKSTANVAAPPLTAFASTGCKKIKTPGTSTATAFVIADAAPFCTTPLYKVPLLSIVSPLSDRVVLVAPGTRTQPPPGTLDSQYTEDVPGGPPVNPKENVAEP